MVALIRTSIRASTSSFRQNIINMSTVRAKHSLPDLPYGYDVRSPVILSVPQVGIMRGGKRDMQWRQSKNDIEGLSEC